MKCVQWDQEDVLRPVNNDPQWFTSFIIKKKKLILHNMELFLKKKKGTISSSKEQIFTWALWNRHVH